MSSGWPGWHLLQTPCSHWSWITVQWEERTVLLHTLTYHTHAHTHTQTQTNKTYKHLQHAHTYTHTLNTHLSDNRIISGCHFVKDAVVHLQWLWSFEGYFLLTGNIIVAKWPTKAPMGRRRRRKRGRVRGKWDGGGRESGKRMNTGCWC